LAIPCACSKTSSASGSSRNAAANGRRKARNTISPALEQLAAAAPPFVSLINPDDPRFLSPDDMPKRIAEFCAETGQPAPANHGAFMRCIYESLALFYRVVVRRLERLTGKKIERLHIVGGGSKASTLNQCAANALKIPVIAGPTECTALGNLLVQAIALGHLPSLDAAREVVHAIPSS
jgi:rhamnulokinase